VKAETGQTVGKTLTLRPWDGVTPTVFSTIVLTGSWQRIACSWTAVNTNALALFIGLEGVAATGDFFGVDAVQIETGSVATDYIDTIGSPVTIPGLLSAAVSQQDSGEDVTNCVEAIVRTQAGSRMYVPLFGITDPTFSVRPLSTEQMRQEIEQNEPRANTVLRSLPDVVDQMVVNITAEVSNV
jgi:hypothetical protein